MSGLQLLLRKELREQVRTMRLPVVVAVFAIVGLLSPVVARYIREIIDAVGGTQLEGLIPEPVVGDAVLQFTKNVGQFGVIIAILVTMGTVAAEKDSGTAAFLLTKPISRGSFLAAKVVAIGVLLAVSTSRGRGAVLGVHGDPVRAAAPRRLRHGHGPRVALPGGLRGRHLPGLRDDALLDRGGRYRPGDAGRRRVPVGHPGARLVPAHRPVERSRPARGGYGPGPTPGLPIVVNTIIIVLALGVAGWSFRRQEL